MGLAHARAIGEGPSSSRVVAVADPSGDRSREVRGLWPKALEFSNPDEMFADADLDVVHVCAPPDSHHSLALEALRRGAHVYVEKPFTSTPEEAREVLDLARERGLRVCAGHQLLRTRAVERALAVLPALGTLHHVESYFSFRPVKGRVDGREPLSDDLQLLDVLPHPVYLLLRAMGLSEPDETIGVEAVRIGRGGTVHALVTAGLLTGTLTVTLRGRPVENHLVFVGEGGTIRVDLVRGTVLKLLGPGTSGISKALNPFRVSTQIGLGTGLALTRRLARREFAYPGLRELVAEFHDAIRKGGPAPIPENEIVGTVALGQAVADRLAKFPPKRVGAIPNRVRNVVVTGGTGFLGRRVVEELLREGIAPLVLARREPPPWERIEGARYVRCDLGREVSPELLSGAHAVIHCAAATQGGVDAHRRSSVFATENLLNAMAQADVSRLVHVSSLAVLAPEPETGWITDDCRPIAPTARLGPYVWGKAESERRARDLAKKLAIQLRVVRPGPIIDLDNLDPPGRLGRQVSPRLFLMVGSANEPLGTVSVSELACLLVRAVQRFEEFPKEVNVVDQPLRTRGELVDRLRLQNPELRVLRMPRALFTPAAVLLQGALRFLRPGGPAPDIRRAFASEPLRLRPVELPELRRPARTNA